MRRAARARGFSAAELMVVLVVAALMLTLALPDLRQLLSQLRLRVAAGELYGALELARAQAVARGAPVALVPLDGGGDWSRGWVVLLDRDGDLRPGSGDEVIAWHGPAPDGVAIRSAFSSHQQPDYFAYNGAGRGCSARSTAAARWGTLSLQQGSVRRLIIVNMLGRSRLCDPTRDAACGDAQ
ncbi:MAG: GspH/FimT family pseudopilin [Pseudomonadota bacterium]